MALECKRQRSERTEEIGAEKAQRRPPEREDDERDRDPTGPLGQPVDPLRRDGEAERRAADPREGAADERVRVAVSGDVDAHRICRRG